MWTTEEYSSGSSTATALIKGKLFSFGGIYLFVCMATLMSSSSCIYVNRRGKTEQRHNTKCRNSHVGGLQDSLQKKKQLQIE